MVIVDDQSFDRTSKLAHEAAKKHSWINYLKEKDNIGPGKVMEAFYTVMIIKKLKILTLS